MRKSVFISFLRPPVGDSFYIEGLRLALGVLGGTEEHEVTVAHLGRGVRSARKGVDRSYARDLLELFPKDERGIAFYVEKEAMESEGMNESELDPVFAPVPRSDLLGRMLRADVTLSF